MSGAPLIDAKTLEDLGWPQLVEQWAQRCATVRGAAAVRGVALFDDPAAAERRILEVGEARHLVGIDAALPLGGIDDVAEAVARAEKGGLLEAAELISVAATGRGLSRLRQHLRQHAEAVPTLAELGGDLEDLAHVFHPILESFDPEGRLVDHASDALGPLRRAVAGIRGQLEKRMKAMVEEPTYTEFLQDRYYTQREDRYVLPVRAEHKGYVKGIVHGTSQSGQTVFLEPDEIVDLNNRLKLAECDVADEERRILGKLTGYVAEESAAYRTGLALAEHLDVVGAAARLGEEIVASAPVIDRGEEPAPDGNGDVHGIHLLHARHPLMLLSGRRCIANDVILRQHGILIISGPNAGGKTVVLKTVGLLALMVRAGLHIPAERDSRMPWFTRIRSDIGDSQSLEMNLSTYSAHLLKLRDFVDAADRETLLLVDEISVGTEPEQGASLAQAVLETLAGRGATAIVTTHYERLKVLGASDPHFANASVGFDLTRMEPTFKLHLGAPGSSGALAVARRLGVPEGIVERAQVLLGQQGADVEQLLTSLSDQRRRMEEERRALLDELEEAEGERLAAQVAREAAREKELKAQRAAHSEAVAALRRARGEIDALRVEARRRAAAVELAEAQAGLADVRRQVSAVAAEVARHEPPRQQLPGKRVTADKLVVGAPVVVVSLGARGEIAEAPQKGRVVVRVGTMHTTVDLGDVLLDSHKKSAPPPRAGGGAAEQVRDRDRDKDEYGYPQQPSLPVASGEARAGARTRDATVDVRGQRVDEAVAVVDQFIDESLLASRDIVFVVHGHGTGAVRSAVRAHVKGHRGVSRWRGGEPSEGGDGVTVLWLDVR
jgi:DNA mismatch repair protein MutS2